MLPALFVLLATTTLPPCELPDLAPVEPAVVTDFEVKPLAGGVRGVAMADPMAEAGERLSGVPDGAPPARPHGEATGWVWSEASGWLLVPRDWRVVAAAVGVDGSWLIDLQGTPGRMRASGTGGCVGCALSAGAAYFPRYAEEARAGEFEFCRGSERPLTHVAGSSDRAHVRYDHTHGTHDLVALVASEDYGYEELVITGATSALRDEVLAAFTVE